MKIKNITAMLSVLVVMASCTDEWLTLEPRTQTLESDYYKTESQLWEAMVATYDVLQWKGYGGYTQIEMISDILSDDALCGGGSATDQPNLQVLEDFSMSPTLSPNGLWGKFYSGINRANIVIEKIDNVTVWEKYSKQRLLAEAHFLRAYYTYQLWRFYGNIPLVDHLLTPEEYNYPQSTPDQVYQKLIEWLDTHVIGKLPDTIEDGFQGRISNDAAIALKARIVLFQNDNAKMAEIASQLKGVIDSKRYQLVPSLDVMFSTDGEYCAESVFEVNHNNASNWGDWGWLSGGEGNIQVVMTGIRDYKGPVYDAGWGFTPVASGLENSFEQGDKRKDWTILNPEALGATYSPGYQNTGFFQKKYAPIAANTHSSNPMINYRNNMRVIRYSDVLLMAAEAILRSSGNVADAQAYYDAVRDRAFGDTSHRKTVSLENIYTERRHEFAMEGIRYWDLIRTGKAAEVLGTKGWKSEKRYLPIPQEEIDKTNGVLKQNQGY
jgi:starch-binding outer membrane protein, SusD/RagB family